MNKIRPGKWNPALTTALNHLIETEAGSEGAYAVFDFDNTSCFGDVEDNLFLYLLETWQYKMQPDEFARLFDECLAYWSDNPEILAGLGPISIPGLVQDLIEAYPVVTDFVESTGRAHLDQFQPYKDFRAKAWYFYRNICDFYQTQAGKVWPTYWFSGYQEGEFFALVVEAMGAMQQKKPQKVIWETDALGQSGVFAVEVKYGLAFPDELLDLYHVFKRHDIRPYIVSASPHPLIEAVSQAMGYAVDNDCVYGVQILQDDQGCLTPWVKEGWPVSVRDGKVQVIDNFIRPRESGRPPLAVFGDSMGDYQMMEAYLDQALVVLFNRVKADGTRRWIELANDDSLSVYIQGRDENNTCLRPAADSILLGEKEAQLIRA